MAICVGHVHVLNPVEPYSRLFLKYFQSPKRDGDWVHLRTQVFFNENIQVKFYMVMTVISNGNMKKYEAHGNAPEPFSRKRLGMNK